VGNCDASCPIRSTVLEFDDIEWRSDVVQRRFRETVDAFAPDVVLVTDAWNFKPLLAEAMQGYRYILRFDALECLCPFNNIRLVPSGGGFRQCYRNQLATPNDCRRCVRDCDEYAGALHRDERKFSNFEHPGYHRRLLEALKNAWAVLAVNPAIATLLEPYADRVMAVPSGIDLGRFPFREKKTDHASVATVLFAGAWDDPIKGFEVLHSACARLWMRRQDFNLLVTADPPGRRDAFTDFLGWQTQTDIVKRFLEADIVVIPSVCQEAMPLVAMEAMAASSPLIASRIGGLPFIVAEGTTGLLFEPGDADDLASQIQVLLDDPGRRVQMGAHGRRRFEEFFSWEAVMSRHYRPLFRELEIAAEASSLVGRTSAPVVAEARN
jgi:glycosyltransferase involved in cell wall biosynthesis